MLATKSAPSPDVLPGWRAGETDTVVVGDCFHAQIFSWAPLTLHPPRALVTHGSLGAQVPHLYMPVSGTISFRFIVLYLILAFFVFWLVMIFYTISFHKNPLAPGTLTAATAYTGALGYTKSHLIRPEQALSRSLHPETCSISGTWIFLSLLLPRRSKKNQMNKAQVR